LLELPVAKSGEIGTYRVLTKGATRMPPIPPDQVSPYGGGYASSDIDDRYLSARQVRRRYGDASEMWIWRRLNDGSRFPQPTVIAGRRFWKLSELIAWERMRAPPTAGGERAAL
jgi:predicted DNA-binding transcriptional regulator AlpA